MGRGRETLSEWLEAEGIVPADGAPDADVGAIADVPRIRGLLVEAARRGEPVSYSELLDLIGLRFSRPKMRALCKTLDAIDAAAAAAGDPELAVLVVRESDRLPGQGWWTARTARGDYAGSWTGRDAAAYVAGVQATAFDYWRKR